jgi:hypothetical protein
LTIIGNRIRSHISHPTVRFFYFSKPKRHNL